MRITMLVFPKPKNQSMRCIFWFFITFKLQVSSEPKIDFTAASTYYCPSNHTGNHKKPEVWTHHTSGFGSYQSGSAPNQCL